MNGFDVSRQGRVVTLRLDGARRNALDAARYAGLRETASGVGADEVLVLRADGPHFCAGQDLDEHRSVAGPAEAEKLLRAGGAAVLAVLRCRGPVVAEVQGAAIGAGALLAAAADVLVIAEDAWLRLPELEMAMPLGCSVMSRILPQAHARRALLTGARISAAHLDSCGAAEKVSADHLDAALRRAVAHVLRLDPVAVAAARRLWGDDERERAARGYEAEIEATVGLLSRGPGT